MKQDTRPVANHYFLDQHVLSFSGTWKIINSKNFPQMIMNLIIKTFNLGRDKVDVNDVCSFVRVLVGH